MRALAILALCSLTATAQPVSEDEVRRDIDALVAETLRSSPNFEHWRSELNRFERLESSRVADLAAIETFRDTVVRPVLARENALHQAYNRRRDLLLAAGSISKAHAESMKSELQVIKEVQLKRASLLRELAKRNAEFKQKYGSLSDPTPSAQNYFSDAIAKRPSKESPRPGYKAKFQTVWNDQFSSPKKFADLIRTALQDKPSPTINRSPAVIPVSPTTDEEVEFIAPTPVHGGSPYIQEYR